MLRAVDDWMQQPGGRVVGHRAVVRATSGEADARVLCTCGFARRGLASVDLACVVLVGHLQEQVRAGALVAFGDDDDGDGGPAGVRDPRRPSPPPGSGAVALDLPGG